MTRKRRTVAPDLDGCLYPYWKAFARNLKDDRGIRMYEPQTWDFYKQLGMTHEDFVEEMIRQIQHKNLFGSEPPLPGAQHAMAMLKKSGLRIVIQTARTYPGVERMAEDQTLEWLDRWDMPYDELRLVRHKGADDIDYAFDDAVHHADEYHDAGVAVILVDQPWNQHGPYMRARNAEGAAQLILLMEATRS